MNGMTIEEARGWAGACWTDVTTSNKEMDVVLAEVFAKMLMARVNEAMLVDKIRQARKTMRDAFAADEEFRQGYVANIAMLLSDRYGIKDYVPRNQAASDILELVFGETHKERDDQIRTLRDQLKTQIFRTLSGYGFRPGDAEIRLSEAVRVEITDRLFDSIKSIIVDYATAGRGEGKGTEAPAAAAGADTGGVEKGGG